MILFLIIFGSIAILVMSVLVLRLRLTRPPGRHTTALHHVLFKGKEEE